MRTERAALGRAARSVASRSSHGAFRPSAGRPDPVELLESQAQLRVPELVPIRYGRMLASPFTFYRGAALIMASDLAGTPTSGLPVQCCGDAHLSNFGLFASPERRLVFDINDFDETLPGPWEWDVKRLAVSLLLAARDNGFGVRDQERIVLAAVAEYRAWMARYAQMRNLDVWYARAEVDKLARDIASRLGAKMRRRLQRRVDKTLRRDSAQAFAKLATEVDGRARIVSQPPLVVPAREFLNAAQQTRLARSLEHVLDEYAATLPARPAGAVPAVPAGGRRAQGGRRRQRRHPRLDRPAAGSRRP